MGEFSVRRVGLGAIYQFSKPLFSAPPSNINRLIGETTASLNKSRQNSFVLPRYYSNLGGGADVNRILVVVFFGFYALFSGLGGLLLIRVSQRRVAAYTIIIVGVASVLAGLLGGYLRFSKGDLNWMTVTQIGAGGAVQFAKIEVQSAGGRSKRVAISGKNPDL